MGKINEKIGTACRKVDAMEGDKSWMTHIVVKIRGYQTGYSIKFVAYKNMNRNQPHYEKVD